MPADAEYLGYSRRPIIHGFALDSQAAGLFQGLSQKVPHSERRQDPVPLEQRPALTDRLQISVERVGRDAIESPENIIYIYGHDQFLSTEEHRSVCRWPFVGRFRLSPISRKPFGASVNWFTLACFFYRPLNRRDIIERIMSWSIGAVPWESTTTER